MVVKLVDETKTEDKEKTLQKGAIITLFVLGPYFPVVMIGDETNTIAVLLMNMLFLIALVGIIKERRFGFYTASMTSFFLLLISFLYVSTFTLFFLISFLADIGVLYLLFSNRERFRKPTRTDHMVGVISLSIILATIYLIGTWVEPPTNREIVFQYKEKALEENDPPICEGLNDLRMIDSCYLEVNKKFNKEEICDAMNYEQSRDFCFDFLAMRTGNKSYCESIMDNVEKNVCLGR